MLPQRNRRFMGIFHKEIVKNRKIVTGIHKRHLDIFRKIHSLKAKTILKFKLRLM